ncbi:MAG: hypothetical protein JO112_06265, partial [Planctomycetes bacterium]|nr:hypothetical protein [Planctomycetota bacterium]
FHFDQAERPGVYLLEVPQRGEENAQPRSDWWAYAVNVDTPNESDLKRASQTELERAAPGVRLFPTPSGAPIVEPQRRTDLSESGWFYLLFLIVLVAEQALAVHLSFHLKGGAVEAVPGRTAEAPAAASAA